MRVFYQNVGVTLGLHVERYGPCSADLESAVCTECGANVKNIHGRSFVAEYDIEAVCDYCNYEYYCSHHDRSNA